MDTQSQGTSEMEINKKKQPRCARHTFIICWLFVGEKDKSLHASGSVRLQQRHNSDLSEMPTPVCNMQFSHREWQ